MQKTDAHGAT